MGETGETLPDTSILLDLANVLETTVDYILSGEKLPKGYQTKIKVSDMIAGLKCIEDAGIYLGKENLIYRSAIEGINEKLNTDIEKAFLDDYSFEAFVAEAIIDNLNKGVYVDITDVSSSFKHDHFKKIVIESCKQHGIK